MSTSSQPNLSKYQIVQEIGRGGMGTVYKGYDPSLDRTVAIKILASHLAWEEASLERFMREARTAARLQHPNIIPVYDVGQDGDNYYFVMAYLPGLSLKQLVAQKGRLVPVEALSILGQLADALDYAHRKGLVHRDVKPANVMFNEHDQAVLMDFGIVKAAEGSRLTGTGSSIGTPHYMSPEQVKGEEVDARADQYALGIVAFEMLTGQVPFDADTTTAVLFKQVNEPPPSITALRPELPFAVEPVLGRALSKLPADRYSSCGEFVRALEQAIAQPAEQPLTPQPATLPTDHVPLYSEPSIEPGRTLLSVEDVRQPMPVVVVPAPQPGPAGRGWAISRIQRPLELVLLVFFGLVSLVGFIGAVCNLFPTSPTGETSFQFLPACASPALAGIGGIVMLWLRNKSRMAWGPSLAAIVLWFVGIIALSAGITTTFLYKEPGEFLSNLGWSAVFCLVPGGFLTLLGLAMYGYGYMRSRRLYD